MGENSAPEGPKFTVRPTSKQPRPDQRDSFRIYLSAGSLLQCKLRVGDPCRIQVANGVVPAKTAIAWSATERIQDSVVQTSKLLQELYGLKLGDKVYISKETEPLAEVEVATLEECAQSAGAGDITEDDRRYWEWGLEYPLCRAEIITVGMVVEQELKGCRRSFRVVDIETATGMGTNTIAQFVGTSKTRIGKKKELKKQVHRSLKVNTAGIGGVSTQIQQLNEKLRDFSLESQGITMPSFYKSSGGVLLHGPKGTGKSLLLSRIEASGWQKVLRVNSSVISRATGDSEATLRKTFAEALRYQPSLISIDQLDFIAPKRGSGAEAASSLASALCECLDSLQESHVLVVACTRHPNDVDDTLRTPHRLGTEIELPVPTAKGRKEILFALRGTDTEPSDGLLDEIAAKTHGYVGADLFSLLHLCCRKALSRHLSSLTTEEEPSINGSNSDQDSKPPVTVRISEEDVSQALLETRPTAMREVFLETPQVRWSDIGGQHSIKKRLRQAVERPIKYPERMKKFNIKGTKGVLLYGPPGCSKTMMVKALATEAGLNFLAVKGAEILSMYVGESERSLRDVFRKARAASPSIIFFDEIDAIATRRGEPGAHAGLNVLTTLLNEMDGIEELKNVLVIAATNKPEVLDPALMRPGRLDHLLYIGPPDMEARKELLDIWFTKAEIDDEVDPIVLASLTEGHSGAEIVSICEAAAEAALDEEEDTGQPQKIKWAHFETALATVPKQITPMVLREYEAWRESFSG